MLLKIIAIEKNSKIKCFILCLKLLYFQHTYTYTNTESEQQILNPLNTQFHREIEIDEKLFKYRTMFFMTIYKEMKNGHEEGREIFASAVEAVCQLEQLNEKKRKRK